MITDISMPDMDGLEAAQEIYSFEPVPIIIISAFHDPDLITRGKEPYSRLSRQADQTTRPRARDHDRQHALQEFRTMRHEADTLRQALDDRKHIERAKGIIMKRGDMDEAEAFRRLQKIARDKNRKLIDIAHMILSVEDIY